VNGQALKNYFLVTGPGEWASLENYFLVTGNNALVNGKLLEIIPW